MSDADTVYVCKHNPRNSTSPCARGCHAPYTVPVDWREWPRTWTMEGYHDAEGLDAVVECTACGQSLAEKSDGVWGDGHGHAEDCPSTRPLPDRPAAEVLLCEDCGTGFMLPGWMDRDDASALAEDAGCPACGAGDLVVYVAAPAGGADV